MSRSDDELLARLETGAGVWDDTLLPALEALPSDRLAERLGELGGHAGCDVAYVLARRNDPRGVAALARAAVVLATAGRALGYLTELGMLDMVAAPYRTDDYRASADAVDLLGSEPAALDVVFSGEVDWPDRAERARADVFSFTFANQPPGLALVGPARLRIDGVQPLSPRDSLALLCGRCFETRATPVPRDQLGAERVLALLARLPDLSLRTPRVVAGYEAGGRTVVVLEAERGDEPGFVVGGPPPLPVEWVAAGDSLDAERAFWLWLGRTLLAEL